VVVIEMAFHNGRLPLPGRIVIDKQMRLFIDLQNKHYHSSVAVRRLAQPSNWLSHAGLISNPAILPNRRLQSGCRTSLKTAFRHFQRSVFLWLKSSQVCDGFFFEELMRGPLI